jgi:hypothetical protein
MDLAYQAKAENHIKIVAIYRPLDCKISPD